MSSLDELKSKVSAQKADNAKRTGIKPRYMGEPLGIELDCETASALVEIAEAARELVTPCEHERGFCIAHGTQRLPCDVATLAAALARLE